MTRESVDGCGHKNASVFVSFRSPAPVGLSLLALMFKRHRIVPKSDTCSGSKKAKGLPQM